MSSAFSPPPQQTVTPRESVAAPPRPRAIRLIEDRWASVRHILEAGAIVAAGAWGFYTFFYQNDIKPAQEPPALHETLKVTRLGRDAQRDFIDASFGFQNAGKTEIDIAADAWNVWGVRYASVARPYRFDLAPMTNEPLIEYHDSIRRYPATLSRGWRICAMPPREAATLT